MAVKLKKIPVNLMDEQFSQGISIDKISIRKSDFSTVQAYEEATQSHRDEGHTFHIVEKGTVAILIDFQEYKIKAPAVVYMHPHQVHRILDFTNMSVYSISIKNENLHPGYIMFLDELVPSKPLPLKGKTYTDIIETFSLCFNFSRQYGNKLRQLILKDSCNALTGLIISAFLNQDNPVNKLLRVELIAKQFRQLLEKNYSLIKRPQEYASQLNISTHYLNESVKTTTGQSVSQHIQERIILESKRLLYHTDAFIL